MMENRTQTVCTGQFRFDMVLSTVELEENMGLYITLLNDNGMFVADISPQFGPGPVIDTFREKTIWIPPNSALEWWFGPRVAMLCRAKKIKV